MKRNIAIAAVTVAVLIGAGGYTAFATADDNTSRAATVSPVASPSASPSVGATHDSGDDHGGDRPVATGPATLKPSAKPSHPNLTANQAAGLALRHYPGVVRSIERDDRNRWEVKILGNDGALRELDVNAATGAVRIDDHVRAGSVATADASARPRAGGHDVGDDHGGQRDRDETDRHDDSGHHNSGHHDQSGHGDDDRGRGGHH